MKKIAVLFSLAAFLAGSSAYSMTVVEAYRLIPHQRTVFRADDSVLPEREAQALVSLFALIDEAIVLRVEAMHARLPKTEEYADLKTRIASLELPAALRNVRKLVSDAVTKQELYLKKKPGQLDPSDPLVGAASRKLQAAYSALMQLYPQENVQNKQAFYDYLCALDFV